MSKKIKWAVIGSGGIARRRTIPEGFIPSRNAHLVSVYGTNAKTNKEVAKEFNAIACDSLDALLKTDIEAVYIASPVHAHLQQVLACAKAGKHVLCEKPLGLNVAEAEENLVRKVYPVGDLVVPIVNMGGMGGMGGGMGGMGGMDDYGDDF